MKKLALTTLIVAVVAGTAAAAWFARQQPKPAAERYRFEAVSRGELRQTVSANGTLNPVSVVSVGTQVSGTVRKLHVDFNDPVKAGQLLLELDDALLAAQARQSEARVRGTEAALRLAIANEQRLRELFAQEYVSRQELDQAVQARESAAAELALARAQAERDQANVSYTRIRSPVAGVVVDRVVDEGQTVAASFQTPTLIKIARDLSKMQIDSSFAEADIGLIREGQSARFTVDAFPDQSFRGVVRQIRLNPKTEQNVVTYNVVIAVDNPGARLLPGMTAYVSITVDERQDALLVPNAALRFRPDDQAEGSAPEAGRGKPRKQQATSGTVYVLDDAQLRPVTVSTGITDQRRTEIVDGELKPGDRLAIGNSASNGQAARGGSPIRMRFF